MLLKFLLLALLISFLLGYGLQWYCLWIDEKNKFAKPVASTVIPKSIKIVLYKGLIAFLSLFRNKEKIYMREMKKALIHGKLEKKLFNVLMNEENPKKMKSIIETVYFYMERNRRRNLPDVSFKEKNFFFIDNVFIENGFGYGIKVADFVEMYIRYNQYLGGAYLEPEIAMKAAKLFGTLFEEEAANLDIYLIDEKRGGT